MKFCNDTINVNVNLVLAGKQIQSIENNHSSNKLSPYTSNNARSSLNNARSSFNHLITDTYRNVSYNMKTFCSIKERRNIRFNFINFNLVNFNIVNFFLKKHESDSIKKRNLFTIYSLFLHFKQAVPVSLGWLGLNIN